MNTMKILIVDDEPNMRFLLSEALGKQGYECIEAKDGHEALERAREDRPDIVLLDLKMPRMGGMEALQEIRALDPDAAVIIITAFGSRDTAYRALEEGAYDFFTKPVDIHDVRTVVGRAAERVRLKRAVRQLQKKNEESFAPENILGQSEVVLQLRDLLRRLAATDSTVLITGESGTGKELAARVIHYQSTRRAGPFVAVNCAAIPESLLEAELFGHEKGAFTGAHQRRIGKFEAGEGGTVFLDEIGDMPASMQAKVLRVLQERTFERLGGVKPVHVTIRLIAATNRDLAVAVKEHVFREDLFYRLNVVPVHLPPLRERKEDIPALAEFFLRNCNGRSMREKFFSPGALRALAAYDWPGNIRELNNVVERMELLSAGKEITEQEITAVLAPAPGSADIVIPDFFNDPKTRERFFLHDAVEALTGQLEKKIIEKALQVNQGKRQETADLLKISRKSLHNKMKKYGID